MSSKQIPIGLEPSDNRQGKLNFKAETWVESRKTSKHVGKMKRLTIDVPAALHRRIKTKCAESEMKMSDKIRNVLLDVFGEEDSNQPLADPSDRD